MFVQLWNKLKSMKLNVKFTILIITFVLVPIAVLSMLLFQFMEESTIKEKLNSMEYSMNKSHDQIIKNVSSINMSTQVFLSDQSLMVYLKQVKANNVLHTKELLDFYERNVNFMERLVDNNPYLYQIRVYVNSDTMQEMMPIFYRKSRMQNLSWASDQEIQGWKFDYTDTIFDSYRPEQNKKIMSLVTTIQDFSDRELGIIEAAMYMETMFPNLYENIDGEWNFFIDQNGNKYYGDNYDLKSVQYLNEILKQMQGKKNITNNFYTKLEGEPVVIGYMPVKELSGTLICVHSAEAELARIRTLRNGFVLIMAFILLFLVFVINIVVKSLLHQLYDVLHRIRKVQKGDLNVVFENRNNDEMGELGEQINKMLIQIKLLMEDNIKREILAKNSEMKNLQNQINAHFLYNVMESIKMMAEIEEQYEISDAITNLGKLLRYSMKWDSNNVTVRDEIDYIKSYLILINLRFDYEIYLSLNIPEIIYAQRIPKMSLQPIVENAIYHGIEQMAEDTNIYIKGIIEGDDCIIEISDAGRGMTEDEVEKLYKRLSGEVEISGGSGNGIGLKNVQDRIKMSYGDKYKIGINSKFGCYTKITVRVPLLKEISME